MPIAAQGLDDQPCCVPANIILANTNGSFGLLERWDL